MGASSSLGDQIWVLVVTDSRPSGLEANTWKLCLIIALEGSNKNFDNIIEEAISVWKNETKYWLLYANPSCYMSSASDVPCSVTSIMFPNTKGID